MSFGFHLDRALGTMSLDLDRDSLIRNNFNILEMKMSPGTQAERESSGFCSGEELEDPDTDSSSRSISDIETRDNKSATPISHKPDHLPMSNKRKHEDTNNNNKHLDIVKRLCNLDSRLSSKKASSSPFRPWDDSRSSRESSPKIEIQEEPLSLVKEKKIKTEDQEMPLDFRKKVYPYKSKPTRSIPEDIKPIVDTTVNFASSTYPYSMFRTSSLLSSPIHQIRNPISVNNHLLNRSNVKPAPFKPLIVHKDPLVDSIPLIPPNLLLPSPLMYTKPFVDNKLNALRTSIKLEDDVRIKVEHPTNDFKNLESILRKDAILNNGLSIKKEPSDNLVTKNKLKDTSRSTLNMKVNTNSRTYSEKLAESSKFIESLGRVPKKHERLDDLKMQNSCISNDSIASSCTNDSEESMLLNDSSYKKKQSSSSQNYNRNYKNMTRERRIEANARERTRVHTISAAFETLRKSVPAYSTNQKLSKLSVLRIACSYIMTLSRIAGHDYSSDQSEPSIADCVEDVTKTIQQEGKVKKKSKDDDED